MDADLVGAAKAVAHVAVGLADMAALDAPHLPVVAAAVVDAGPAVEAVDPAVELVAAVAAPWACLWVVA